MSASTNPVNSFGTYMEAGVPHDMIPTNKPLSIPARMTNVSVGACNGTTFAPGSIVQLQIGGCNQRNTYLDTRSLTVTFDVVVNVVQGEAGFRMVVNDTAYSFFSSMNSYIATYPVDSISGWGDVSTFLLNLGINTSEKASLGRVIGAAPDGSTTGHVMNMAAVGEYRRTFTLPLMSFFSSTKFMNLGSLNSDIRFDLTLAQTLDAVTRCLTPAIVAPTAFGDVVTTVNAINTAVLNPRGVLPVANVALGYTVQNIRLQYSIIELEGSGVALVESLRQQEQPGAMTTYFGRSYKTSTVSIPNGTTGNFDANVCMKLASLTGAYARFRWLTAVNTNVRASTNPNAGSATWQIGNTMDKPVFLDQVGQAGGYADAFRSLATSRAAWGGAKAGSAIAWNDWYHTHQAANADETGVRIGTSQSSFALGYEGEAFPQEDFVSGTAVNNVALKLQFAAATALTLCDIILEHDVLVSIQNGQVIVRN
jgi:hypothetical protein